MTIKASRFNPEVLLSAPRRSPGNPNSDGSKILYSVSVYSFEQHKRTSEVRLLDATSKKSTLVTITDGASGFSWIDDKTIIGLAPDEKKKGATRILIGHPENFADTKYVAGTVDAAIEGLLVRKLGDGSFVLGFAAPTKPDGSLYNAEKAKKQRSTGRLYEHLFARHWDLYESKNRMAVWYATLSKDASKDSLLETRSIAGGMTLSEPFNALKDTGLISPIYQATGSDWNWDISESGLVFVAKDPTLDKAIFTKQTLYVAQRDKSASTYLLQKPVQIPVPDFEGATSNPVFSPDGKSVAFFSMQTVNNEADKSQLWIMPDFGRPAWLNYMYGNEDFSGRWDRSITSITWSVDSKSLFLTAGSNGADGLYVSSTDPMRCEKVLPIEVMNGISISSVRTVGKGDLFISGSTLVDNSVYYCLTNAEDITTVLTPSIEDQTSLGLKLISSNTNQGAKVGLDISQISSIYYDGADSTIHAWVVFPSDFNPRKKYPLAYLVHGGPQGAWNNGWSTRWNPAVYAEQGYVVVLPNPTGSTGYGQALTDAIKGEWGGLPYIDLEKGMEFIEQNMAYVDMDRAVALGASYGGYMMNYFQGMPIASKFKALVTHDGIFSIPAQMSTDELFFAYFNLNGPYWDSQPPAQMQNILTMPDLPASQIVHENLDLSGKSPWIRWDPAHPVRVARGWRTPHLIIHSDLDYRLAVSEGLAAFNVLQTKGTKCRFLEFPDENHWVLKPENSLLWHKVVLDWINEAVGLESWDNKHAAELLGEAEMD